jgi:ATP-dependent Clp protease ATP-binding subunit ClpC
MFERFTDRARRVVVGAQEEARDLGHNYIGTEHLLLGILREGDGTATRVLTSLGITGAAVREKVEAGAPPGQHTPSGHIPFTPPAKKVLELSLRESLDLKSGYIGTEHILLALIREGDGLGAKVLTGLGANLDDTRRRVVTLLSGRDLRESAQSSARLMALPRRVSAIERWIGLPAERVAAAERAEAELLKARLDKAEAMEQRDFRAAAAARAREKQLATEPAAGPDDAVPSQAQPTLADEVRELRAEVDRLRALLVERGLDADDES